MRFFPEQFMIVFEICNAEAEMYWTERATGISIYVTYLLLKTFQGPRKKKTAGLGRHMRLMLIPMILSSYPSLGLIRCGGVGVEHHLATSATFLARVEVLIPLADPEPCLAWWTSMFLGLMTKFLLQKRATLGKSHEWKSCSFECYWKFVEGQSSLTSLSCTCECLFESSSYWY